MPRGGTLGIHRQQLRKLAEVFFRSAGLSMSRSVHLHWSRMPFLTR